MSSSEPVSCEKCKSVGQRPLTHHAPIGWLYMETMVEVPGGGDRVITYACTPLCAEALWQSGPGPQLPDVGRTAAAAIARHERFIRGEVPDVWAGETGPALAALADHPGGGLVARLEVVEAKLAALTRAGRDDG